MKIRNIYKEVYKVEERQKFINWINEIKKNLICKV